MLFRDSAPAEAPGDGNAHATWLSELHRSDSATTNINSANQRTAPVEIAAGEHAELKPDGKPVQTTVKTREPIASGTPAVEADQHPNASCPSSPTYIDFIDTLSQYYFDPKELGDIQELSHRYDCQIHSEDDAVKFATKAVEGIGDRYTRVISKEDQEADVEEQTNQSVGIGVDVVYENQSLKITDVFAATPAEKAGLKIGDRIVAIDGHPTSGLEPDDADKLLIGGKNTSVKLTVDRDGKTFETEMTRVEYKVNSATDSDLGGGIAYIEFPSFIPNDTIEQVKQALERHSDAKGFVIDLRQNPGGLVDNAVGMAELFVKKGVLTTLREREASDPSAPSYDTIEKRVSRWFEIESTVSDRWGFGCLGYGYKVGLRHPDIVGDRPVVILVNQETASAAEMFTSAVRDNGNATVVGEQTYGKGIGQAVVDGFALGTGLHVTDLRYYTPSGQWLGDGNKNRIGITPDVSVTNPPDTVFLSPEDKQLQTAVTILQSKIH